MSSPALEAVILEQLLPTLFKIRYAERESSCRLFNLVNSNGACVVASTMIILFDHGMPSHLFLGEQGAYLSASCLPGRSLDAGPRSTCSPRRAA